jgi:hypothetical protein
MSPQITALSERFATHITAIWMLQVMYMLMILKKIPLIERFVRNTTGMRKLPTMYMFMPLQMSLMREWSRTNISGIRMLLYLQEYQLIFIQCTLKKER